MTSFKDKKVIPVLIIFLIFLYIMIDTVTLIVITNSNNPSINS